MWAVFDPGILRFTLRLLGGFPGFFDLCDSLLDGGDICLSCWLVYLWGVSYE